MAGMLVAERHYVNGSWMTGGGTMGYWPIGTVYEEDIFAAQPNNYVAVIEGDGNLEHAVRVIETMLSSDTYIYILWFFFKQRNKGKTTAGLDNDSRSKCMCKNSRS